MMMEYYLEHIVKAVSSSKGWQVSVIDSNRQPMQVHTSSASYPTAIEAICAGKEYIRRQAALSLLWGFLCECQHSGKLSELELDALSASLCFFCTFRDSYSPHDYWYW